MLATEIIANGIRGTPMRGASMPDSGAVSHRQKASIHVINTTVSLRSARQRHAGRLGYSVSGFQCVCSPRMEGPPLSPYRLDSAQARQAGGINLPARPNQGAEGAAELNFR